MCLRTKFSSRRVVYVRERERAPPPPLLPALAGRLSANKKSGTRDRLSIARAALVAGGSKRARIRSQRSAEDQCSRHLVSVRQQRRRRRRRQCYFYCFVKCALESANYDRRLNTPFQHTHTETHTIKVTMQEVVQCKRVIPRIVCTRASFCDDDLETESNNNHSDHINNNSNKNIKVHQSHMARQKKISRSRVRRNSRRLTLSASDCRRSSSSSRSPSPIVCAAEKRSQRCTDVAEDEAAKNLMNCCEAPGYRQYLELLDVPSLYWNNVEWSEPSGDDLSSEWDSDQSFKGEKIDDEEIENRLVVKVYIHTRAHERKPVFMTYI